MRAMDGRRLPAAEARPELDNPSREVDISKVSARLELEGNRFLSRRTTMAKDDASPLAARVLSLACALLFLGVVAVNGLANALPLNGVTTGALSDELPNLFV